MKKKILLITILLITNLIQSQTEVSTNVKPEEVYIRDENNNSFPFFGSKTQLINSFGQPLQVKRILGADMLDYEIVEDYIYDGLKVRIETRPNITVSISFEITNKNYGIWYKNKLIKLGDNIDLFKTIFNNSYNIMLDGNKKFLRIEFDETNTATPYYSPLFIEFDKNTKLITAIGISIL